MFSKSIAIVDDNEDLVNLFKQALQMNGYSVYGFIDPIQALDYMETKPEEFALVVSDYKMPSMNGCDFCNILMRLNPKLQFIILSAYDYIPYEVSRFKIIKKPVSISKFLQIVKETMPEEQGTKSKLVTKE